MPSRCLGRIKKHKKMPSNIKNALYIEENAYLYTFFVKR